MTEATQAVATEPAASAEPDATVTGARDGEDLSTLLQEFDSTTKPPVAEPTPAPQKVAAPDPNLTAKVNKLEAHFNELELKKAISNVRGDLDPEIFDDAIIEGFLHAQARAKPKLNEVYDNRAANPQAWDKVAKALNSELKARFSKLPDRAATEDREAVAHAVRGSSNRLPEGKAPNYANQSNAEFRKSVREQYGYDPGV